MDNWDFFRGLFMQCVDLTGQPALIGSFMMLMVDTFISLIFGGRSKLLIRARGEK